MSKDCNHNFKLTDKMYYPYVNEFMLNDKPLKVTGDLMNNSSFEIYLEVNACRLCGYKIFNFKIK